MGLSLLGAMISGGIYKVPKSSKAIIDNYHFRHMLYQFASHVLEDHTLSPNEMESLKKLGRNCVKYLQMKAYDCPSYMQIMMAFYDLLVKTGLPEVNHRKKQSNS